MALVTFQVIDGVDKGRVFLDLPTPVTLGREEGNTIRLNDERISRILYLGACWSNAHNSSPCIIRRLTFSANSVMSTGFSR